MGEADASRRAPPVETVDRARSRHQWPPLPASQRVRAVSGFRAWAEDAGRRASSPPDSAYFNGACERLQTLRLRVDQWHRGVAGRRSRARCSLAFEVNPLDANADSAQVNRQTSTRTRSPARPKRRAKRGAAAPSSSPQSQRKARPPASLAGRPAPRTLAARLADSPTRVFDRSLVLWGS